MFWVDPSHWWPDCKLQQGDQFRLKFVNRDGTAFTAYEVIPEPFRAASELEKLRLELGSLPETPDRD